MSLQPSAGANRKRFSAASHRQKPKEVIDAAKRDDAVALRNLLKDGHNDPNEDECGGTALHIAAFRGYVGSLQVFFFPWNIISLRRNFDSYFSFILTQLLKGVD